MLEKITGKIKCFFGCHKYQYLPPPDGIMGGIFAPCYCIRPNCNYKHDGFPAPAWPEPPPIKKLPLEDEELYKNFRGVHQAFEELSENFQVSDPSNDGSSEEQLSDDESLDEYPLSEIRVPDSCPCCNSIYLGGHELPGNKMKERLRIFYCCGSSLSVKSNGSGGWLILVKNCHNSTMYY